MRTFFISGHRQMTLEEFQEHYAPQIDEAILKGGSFVVGDCEGVDDMSQQYLISKGIQEVTVYHMFQSARYGNGLKTKGSFKSDFDRDFQMTKDSNYDIAWIRKGKERSGTAQNLERRKWYNERTEQGLPCTRTDLIHREVDNFL